MYLRAGGVALALAAISSLCAPGQTDPARKESEGCFTCHDDKRPEFDSPVSSHNVTHPRRLANADVPSLRPAILNPDGSKGRSLGPGTSIHCSDCHSGDHAGLERRYEIESSGPVNYQPGPEGSYALCDKCHDVENSIMRDRSFKRHSMHVGGAGAACGTCHTAHGIPDGDAANHSALTKFDRAIVSGRGGEAPRWEKTGAFSGRCYLRCHGEDHAGYSY